MVIRSHPGGSALEAHQLVAARVATVSSTSLQRDQHLTQVVLATRRTP
jgi:hypothetical protein